MTALGHFGSFVADVEASSYFKKWASSYPAEAAAWKAWRTALLAGKSPPAPNPVSRFGEALVDAGLLYLDAAAAPPPPPPGYPPTTLAVHHFWYGSDGVDQFDYAADSPRMDDLVVHAPDSWARGANFLSHQPRGHALMYQNFGIAGDGVATVLDIATCRSKGWLAHTKAGAEIPNPWKPDGSTLVVDVGKPGVREAYVAAMRGKASYSSWSGVAADDVNEWNNLWAKGQAIDPYASPDDFWNRAMLPLVSYVGQQLAADGKSLFPNVGDLPGYPMLASAVAAASGVTCEPFLTWGNGGEISPNGIENTYAVLRACVAQGKVFNAICHRNDAQGARFAFCAAAIMAGDSPASLRLAVQAVYGSQPLLWDPVFETALGAPAGPVVHALGSTAWTRPFAGGRTVSCDTHLQTGTIS